MTEQHPSTEHQPPLGVAGRMAQTFIHSPLSPLLYFAMLFMGLLGLFFTPRQEDPQISVPMIDIFVQYPGAQARQVESLAIEPLQRLMSEITQVEHVYSATQRGQGMVTVQFEVGEDFERSVFKVYDRIHSNLDKMPPGVLPPLIKPKTVDDVPMVTLTLWSWDADDGALRALALEVMQKLKSIPNTGKSFIVGGRPEQVLVEVKPERLSGFGISLGQIAQTIQTANNENRAGYIEANNAHFPVYTGTFLHSAHEVEQLVVGSHQGKPIYVRDIAEVTQGPAQEPNQIVNYFSGPAYGYQHQTEDQQTSIPAREVAGAPAVTIALAKKSGTNGVTVAEAILTRIEELKGQVIHDNVYVEVTRNYGQTADDKVNDLIKKLFIATGAVTVLVFFALGGFRFTFRGWPFSWKGWRPAAVVTLVIPVVILITVFSAWILGYTIDRVSLFALIFSIGILVDDAIVVIENIYRRWLLKGETDTATAVDAVREVGNPTILATFTVVAALLPMGFVSGMMGPYMEPIPALGSVAMIFSLFAAFVFTPFLAMSNWFRPSLKSLQKAEYEEHTFNENLERFYRRLLPPLFTSRVKGYAFLLSLIILFFAACALFYTKHVEVKMLPLDNKPVFDVYVDMPEGTTLFETANWTRRLAERLLSAEEFPEITAMQTYVGTSQPFDFNGMVRHYYLRDQPWQADIHVQLKHKKDRARSSHEIALHAREILKPLIEGTDIHVTVVEMPPGPPVLQSVVAEIYGPDEATRRQLAEHMTTVFQQADILKDVDNYMAMPYERWHFRVDTEKAVRRGISVDTINQNLIMAMDTFKVGDVKRGHVLEPTYIVIRVPLSERAQLASLYDLPIPSPTGNVVPLAELGEFIKISQDPIYYQKDLRPIEYVVGDSVGRYNETTHEYSESAPIYGMLEIESLLTDYQTPDGVNLVQAGCTHKFYIIPICQRFLGPPEEYGRSGFEWTGEWTVTYETFRDMGLAFGAALILIYILVVWEFGNFIVPAIIMVPIPLTLLGIIPGHWLFDAEFTATSMIGWIALAGIIVRNSILLVDYSIHEIQQGSSIHDAVILACKTRTRPILITAFALVAGSTVILFDPIFQGMAISLLFGVLISTLLTLVVIPLGCISIGPEALGGNDNPPPPSSTVMSPQKPTPPPSSGTPLWLRIWGAIISVIIFIVTLIISLVQRLKAGIHAIISPPKPVAPKPQESKTQSQAPAASPSQLPVETDQPLSTTVAQTTPTVAEDKQTEKQPEDTKTTSEAQTTETPTTPLVSAETQKQITEDKADEAQSTQQQDSVPSATEKTAQQAEASTHDAQSPQHIPDVTAPQPAVTPSAADEISKPTALDEEKTQQTENLSEQASGEKQLSGDASSSKKTPAKATTAKKKSSSRRGIRLKTDLSQQDSKNSKDKDK